MEFWAEIKGYEGVYCVSSKGKVKHLASIHKTKIRGTECQRKTKEKILKPWKRSNYFLVDLWKNGERDIRSIHILVFEAFKTKVKKGNFVHHKDGNKENNSIENLEEMSVLEHNRKHHVGKPSWNKGLHTGNQYTRRKNNGH